MKPSFEIVVNGRWVPVAKPLARLMWTFGRSVLKRSSMSPRPGVTTLSSNVVTNVNAFNS